MLKYLTIGLCLLNIVLAQKPTAELVPSLPEMETFPYAVYSGYVPIPGTNKENHYLLVESQGDWQSDPLLIWFNGGPGCSSMLGWATENGPWSMPAGGTTFEKNPHSWNTRANVLYIEQPAGVGYSYCDPAHKDQCVFDDDTSAEDNMAFLHGWYAKFPDYKNHTLYISGESYAGLYVPLLSLQISNFNKNQTDPSTKINLQGMMVGNGCTNWTYDCQPATNNMTYGHAIFNTEIWDKMVSEQCDYSGCEFGRNPSESCMGYLDATDELMTDIDLYNIYLPVWGYEGMCSAKENDAVREGLKHGLGDSIPRRPFKPYRFTGDYSPWSFRHQKAKNSEKRNLGCLGGDPLTAYLNNAAVKEALHIPAKIQAWSDCSGIDYTEQEKGSQYVWEQLKGEIRMLKYSGDKDGVVPAQGSIGWINALNRTEVAPWKAWTDGAGQVGGYYWQLDGLDYGTVHGAGHMVPQDEPQRAHQLIFNWLAGGPIDPTWASPVQ